MTTSRTRLWLYPEYDENGDLNLTGDVNVPRNLNVQGVVNVFNGQSAQVGSFGGDGSGLSAEVSITAAQIKAIRATPITLVPAPGAGKMLELLGCELILDYGGSNVFTESTNNLAVKYTDGSGAVVSQTIEMTGFIDQSADTATNALPKIDIIVAKTGIENKALVLHNTSGAEIAGNAANDNVVRVKTAYRVWSTGW